MQENEQTVHQVFIAGALGTNEGNEWIYRAQVASGLANTYAAEASTVSLRELDRAKIARLIGETARRLDEGGRVRFVVHSMGAVELSQVFAGLERYYELKRKNFDPKGPSWQERLRQLEVVFIAPWGMIQRASEYLDMWKRVVRKDHPVFHGINSVGLLVPTGISEVELAAGLQSIVEQMVGPIAGSAITEGTIPHRNGLSREGYFSSLPVEEQERIHGLVVETDRQLVAAIRAKNWQGAAEHLVERGKILRPEVDAGADRFFGGQIQALLKGKSLREKWSTASFLVGSFLRMQFQILKSEPFEIFQKFYMAGGLCRFIIPTLDVIYSFEDATRFFGQDANETLIAAMMIAIDGVGHDSFALSSAEVMQAVSGQGAQ